MTPLWHFQEKPQSPFHLRVSPLMSLMSSYVTYLGVEHIARLPQGHHKRALHAPCASTQHTRSQGLWTLDEACSLHSASRGLSFTTQDTTSRQASAYPFVGATYPSDC